jgi:Trypsin
MNMKTFRNVSAVAILAGAKSSHRPTRLLVGSSNQIECSGTLVAPDVVITAAHCIGRLVYAYVDYSAASSKVSVPLKPKAGESWKRIEIADQAKHPEWMANVCPRRATHDVALLHLKEAVEGIKPVPIAARAPKLAEKCSVIGYGRHNASNRRTEVEAEIADWTYGERRRAEVKLMDVTDAYITAQGVTGAPSSGDSGGTWLKDGKLVGVHSCSKGRHGTATELEKTASNLQDSRAFIDETLEKWAR